MIFDPQIFDSAIFDVSLGEQSSNPVTSAGGGRRPRVRSRILSADFKPIKFEPEYSEKELVVLIKKAAEEESRQAEIQLENEARRLDDEIRTIKDIELAISRFRHAFVRANEQIQNKYRNDFERLQRIKRDMEQEEEFIMKLLLEAV